MDVDFTWAELQNPGYIALGAFDCSRGAPSSSSSLEGGPGGEWEGGGEDVPVAFIIGEISRLDETKV